MANPALMELTQSARAEVVTPEEFMALPVERAELIDGRVIEEVPPTFDHDEIALTIGMALRKFVGQNKLGRVATGGSFQTQENKIRSPDVSFVAQSSDGIRSTASLVRGGPTLAVEIISANDTYTQVEEKAEEYLAAGSRSVWIVDPRRQTVAVIDVESGRTVYHLGDIIPGGNILPNFQLPVAEIFAD